MTDISGADLVVADASVFNNDIHVLIDFQPFQRRYRYEGEIGIDGKVEPLTVTSYRPHEPVDEQAAERGKSVAETYVNKQTPYSVWDGKQKYWQRDPTLRGLDFQRKNAFRLLTDAEKRELIARLQKGDIVLTAELEDDDE